MLNCWWASVNSAELQHRSHRELVGKAGSQAPLQTSWNLTRAPAICVHQVWEALIQKTQKEKSSILSASESNWNHPCESGPLNLSGICFPTCKMKSMGLTCQHPFWLVNITETTCRNWGLQEWWWKHFSTETGSGCSPSLSLSRGARPRRLGDHRVEWSAFPEWPFYLHIFK